MEIESERILLRGWREEDAPMLYRFASDPDVGPRAGWLAHTTVDESREVIRTVFSNPTTWAIVLKSNGLPIGAMDRRATVDCPPSTASQSSAIGWQSHIGDSASAPKRCE